MNASSGSRWAGDFTFAVSVAAPSGCETVVPAGTPFSTQWKAVSTVSSLSRMPVHRPLGGMLMMTARVGPVTALPPMIGWSDVADGSTGLGGGPGGSMHAATGMVIAMAMTRMTVRMGILSGTCRG